MQAVPMGDHAKAEVCRAELKATGDWDEHLEAWFREVYPD